MQGVRGLGEHTGEKGGEQTGPDPADRGRPGSKRHLIVDGGSIPLAAMLTGSQVHDSKVFEDLVDTVEPVKGSRGATQKTAHEAPCRQVLQLPALPEVPPQKGNRGPNRQEGHRKRSKVGPLPLDRREYLRLAVILQAAYHSLRAAGRHPRSIPRTRLRVGELKLATKEVMRPSLNLRSLTPLTGKECGMLATGA